MKGYPFYTFLSLNILIHKTMIYRYIYKITCTAGYFKDHFYFGQHTTKDLNDGYKGSGTKIGFYYKKYPNEYIKEIISYHNSEEELNKAEYDIIHPWLGNELCLNIVEGGHKNYEHLPQEQKHKISKSLNEYYKTHISSHKGTKLTDEHKSNISKGVKGKAKWIKLSEEHKRKISEKHKGKTPHNKNKHGIFMWVHNDIEEKFIKTEKLDSYIKLGYQIGRDLTIFK